MKKLIFPLIFALAVLLCATGQGLAATATLSAIEDTYVWLDDDGDGWQNFGGNAEMIVGEWDGDSPYGKCRGYLMFDLSSIPTGQTITSATLHLSCKEIYSAPVTTGAHFLSDDTWDEYTITWNSAPTGFNATATDTITLAVGDNTWDVLSDVSIEYAGDKAYSVVMKLPVEGASIDGAWLYQDEHSVIAERPTLVVEYEEDDDSVLKFQQLPLDGLMNGEYYYGHDEFSTAYSWYDDTGLFVGYEGCYMADDFADLANTSVVSIRWWGSYIMFYDVAPVQRFLIVFEEDIPAVGIPGDANYVPSHPGDILSSEIVTASWTGVLNPGEFSENMVSGGGYPCYENLFEYKALLKNPFPEEANNVYWLKIVALIDIDPYYVQVIKDIMLQTGLSMCELYENPTWELPYVTMWGWHNRDYTRMDPYASTPPAVNPGEHIQGQILMPDQTPQDIWHFQDDAVYGDVFIYPDDINLVVIQNEDGWKETYYKYYLEYCDVEVDGPEGIDMYSKDLAFELYTIFEEEPNDLDFGDAPDAVGALLYPTLLANGGANHTIDLTKPWLGTLGDAPDAEPDGQPDPQALGDDNDTIYPPPNDDEDGVVFFSMVPGTNSMVIVDVHDPAGVGGAGAILEIWIDWDFSNSWEAGELAYSGIVNHGTTPLTIAVPAGLTAGTTFARCRISTTGTGSPTGNAPDGEVEDYEVYIEPGEEPVYKWSQPPVLNDPSSQYPDCYWGWDEPSAYGGDPAVLWFPCWANPRQCHGDADGLQIGGFWVNGADLAIINAAFGSAYPSPLYDPCADFNRDGYVDVADMNIFLVWFNVPSVPADCPTAPAFTSAYPIVADDWICEDNRPVTDVHWWGSYTEWYTTRTPGDVLGFHIAIWTDVPAGFDEPWSHPGWMVWEYIADISEVNEQYDGCDWHEDYMMYPDSCFRYDLNIPEENWFYQEQPNTIYWISISAIYPDQYESMAPWGWKTRPHYFNDDAVRIFLPMDPTLGYEFEYGEPIEDLTGQSWDMAFELTTIPECFDNTHADYGEWVLAGKPQCWCYKFHCYGDANGTDEGSLKKGYYWVSYADLAIVTGNWKGLSGDTSAAGDYPTVPGAICGDVDRSEEGSLKKGYYRVSYGDLATVTTNWKGNTGDTTAKGDDPYLHTCGGEL